MPWEKFAVDDTGGGDRKREGEGAVVVVSRRCIEQLNEYSNSHILWGGNLKLELLEVV